MIESKILSSHYESENNQPNCSLHENSNFVAFCMKDKQLLCSQCMLLDNHSKHEILGIQKAAQTERKLLLNKTKQLEAFENQFQNSFNAIDLKYKQFYEANNQIHGNIKQFFDIIKQSIQKAENDINKFIEKVVNLQGKQLMDERKSSYKQVVSIKKAKNNIQGDKDDLTTLLNSHNIQLLMQNFTKEVQTSQQKQKIYQNLQINKPQFQSERLLHILWVKLRSGQGNDNFTKYNLQNDFSDDFDGKIFSLQELLHLFVLDKQQLEKEKTRGKSLNLNIVDKENQANQQTLNQKSPNVGKKLKEESKNISINYQSNNNISLRSWGNDNQTFFESQQDLFQQDKNFEAFKQSIDIAFHLQKEEVTKLQDINENLKNSQEQADINVLQENMQLINNFNQNIIKTDNKQIEQKPKKKKIEIKDYDSDDTPKKLRKQQALEKKERMLKFASQVKIPSKSKSQSPLQKTKKTNVRQNKENMQVNNSKKSYDVNDKSQSQNSNKTFEELEKKIENSQNQSKNTKIIEEESMEYMEESSDFKFKENLMNQMESMKQKAFEIRMSEQFQINQDLEMINIIEQSPLKIKQIINKQNNLKQSISPIKSLQKQNQNKSNDQQKQIITPDKGNKQLVTPIKKITPNKLNTNTKSNIQQTNQSDKKEIKQITKKVTPVKTQQLVKKTLDKNQKKSELKTPSKTPVKTPIKTDIIQRNINNSNKQSIKKIKKEVIEQKQVQISDQKPKSDIIKKNKELASKTEHKTPVKQVEHSIASDKLKSSIKQKLLQDDKSSQKKLMKLHQKPDKKVNDFASQINVNLLDKFQQQNLDELLEVDEISKQSISIVEQQRNFIPIPMGEQIKQPLKSNFFSNESNFLESNFLKSEQNVQNVKQQSFVNGSQFFGQKSQYANNLKQEMMRKLKEADSFLKEKRSEDQLEHQIKESKINIQNYGSNNQSENEILEQFFIKEQVKKQDTVDSIHLNKMVEDNFKSSIDELIQKIQIGTGPSRLSGDCDLNQIKELMRNYFKDKICKQEDTIKILPKEIKNDFESYSNNTLKHNKTVKVTQSNGKPMRSPIKSPMKAQQIRSSQKESPTLKQQQNPSPSKIYNSQKKVKIAPNSHIIVNQELDEQSPFQIEKFDNEANQLITIDDKNQALKDFSCIQLPNKNILFIGGRKNRRVLGTCMEYNISKQKWFDSDIMMSKPKCNASCIIVNEKYLYICGGRDAYNKVISDVEIIDLQTTEQLKCLNMICKRTDASIIEFENQLILLGGFGGEEQSTVQSYLKSCESIEINDDQACFQDFPSICMSRAGFQSISLNGLIYVFGGYNGAQYLNSVEKYDPIIQCWTYLTFLNTERANFSIMVNPENENEVLIFGGFNGQPLNSVEKYNAEKNKLQNMNNMDKKRYKHFSFII